jgi:hypothetical protein
VAGKSTLDHPIKKFAKIEFPMDTRTILFHFSKLLLEHEKTEILEYDTIYYMNLSDRQKKFE